MKAHATRYSLINGELYWHSFSGSYLRCLPKEEAEPVVEQVHQGVCGTHIGGQTLCHRIVTRGYYCPTMKHESEAFVRCVPKVWQHHPCSGRDTPLCDESLAFLYIGNKHCGSFTFSYWPTEVHAGCY